MRERYPPDDPREWLNRAHSNLVLARIEAPGVYVEDLCFEAQQAAEKAIKALLIHRNIAFPYIHDIGELLMLVEEAGQDIPEIVRQAAQLTRFAVFARYPGIGQPVGREEYMQAIHTAEAVVGWAESIVERPDV